MADEPILESFAGFDGGATDAESKRRSSQQQQRRRPPQQQQQQRPYRSQPYDMNQGDDSRKPGGRFQARRKICTFCADKVKGIDWKNVGMLRRYMNSNGSIRARRKTGTCAKHQRQLAVAIKRARHLALTPFTEEHARLSSR
jgi:small subunit ribosomal protein S18